MHVSRREFLLAILAGGALMVSACQKAQSHDMVEDAVTKVTGLADAYVNEYFRAFPYQAIEFGAPDLYPDRLGDHSLAALKRWQDREDALLKELRTIPVATLEGTPQAVTYRFLQHQLETAQAFRACRTELWNVSPTFTGWQAEFSVVAGPQATATDEDRRNALARFSEPHLLLLQVLPHISWQSEHPGVPGWSTAAFQRKPRRFRDLFDVARSAGRARCPFLALWLRRPLVVHFRAGSHNRCSYLEVRTCRAPMSALWSGLACRSNSLRTVSAHRVTDAAGA